MIDLVEREKDQEMRPHRFGLRVNRQKVTARYHRGKYQRSVVTVAPTPPRAMLEVIIMGQLPVDLEWVEEELVPLYGRG